VSCCIIPRRETEPTLKQNGHTDTPTAEADEPVFYLFYFSVKFQDPYFLKQGVERKKQQATAIEREREKKIETSQSIQSTKWAWIPGKSQR